MRKYLIVAILLGLFIIGCATNRYKAADQYLEQENYQSALKEYIRLAEESGSLNLSRDIRALTGAMIAYFSLGDYKKSFALSKRILSIDTYNSSAIFYAGMNLEQKKKFTLAKRIYRYYQFLPQSDPYYDLIKSRFKLMVEREMEARAKMAVQLEKSVGLGQVVDNTLAVLYFVNLLDDPRWNAISKGIAEMMITDFSQVKKLRVIERVQLQKLLEEMELGMAGLSDENTAPRMGKLLRAKNLVQGAYMVKAGRNLTINSEIIDVPESSNFGENEYSGELKDILNIEKKIVFSTLEKLGITIPSEVKKRIKQNTTKSIQAFIEFCNGLDEYDNGNYETALSHFQKAVKYDPKFRIARNMATMTYSLGVVKRGGFMAKHPLIMKRKFAAVLPGGRQRRGVRGRNIARYRLQQLAINLDLGYLPGNDSRNGSSELLREDVATQLPDWIYVREILPLPPRPPITSPETP